MAPTHPKWCSDANMTAEINVVPYGTPWPPGTGVYGSSEARAPQLLTVAAAAAATETLLLVTADAVVAAAAPAAAALAAAVPCTLMLIV